MKGICFSALVFLATSIIFTSPLCGENSNSDLDRVAKPHVHVHQATLLGPSGYSPSQIRRAYGFNKISNNGAGQKIAIIDAYGSPTIQKDLETFCTQFGLPQTVVQIYYPEGVPTITRNDWAMETALDVEWAHAIAPGATICLIVAKDAMLTTLLNAVDYAVSLGANQVSMSWGANEFSSAAYYDSHFNKPGVSFTASSGDHGAGVLWPAVSPSVTAVGGTTLKFNIFGCVSSENAWSGSGGGTSAYVSIPSYQSSFQTSTMRMVPDVSYNADPATGFSVYNNGRWTTVGGTSAGAPQWAALIALVNSSSSNPLDQLTSSLYKLGDPTIRTHYYRDVTSGNNGGFNAGIGYDQVTGLGSPRSNYLVPVLIAH